MKYAIYFVVLFFLFACNSEKSTISLDLIPVKQGDYWGYADQTGKMIINPQFKSAFAFTEGLALVQSTGNMYGFIDKKGNYVIQPIYKSALAFTEGLAAATKPDQRIEYIDKKGDNIITLGTEVDKAYGFKEGLALIQSNGRYGYIDRKGKIVIPCLYKNADSFCEGLAAVSTSTKDKSLFGYIDRTGNMVIAPQFKSGNPFFGGRAVFEQKDKYGFIDKEGKIVINPQFDDAIIFLEGLCPVRQGELWGYIDINGRMVINPQFKEALPFTNGGLASIRSTSNDKWGFINKEGKIVVEPQFEAPTYFVDHIGVAEMGDKYGIIDEKGKYKFNPQFDAISIVSSDDYYVASDYFDASSLSGLLFRDVNSSSFKGIRKEATFTSLQQIFPNLSHDNYSSFTPSGFAEENGSLELDNAGIAFDNSFIIDGSNYNDNAVIVGIYLRYRLKNKAKDKAADVIRLLNSRIPGGFQSEYGEGNYLLIHSSSYYVKFKVEDDYLYAIMAFSKDSLTEENDPRNYEDDDESVISVDTAVAQ